MLPRKKIKFSLVVENLKINVLKAVLKFVKKSHIKFVLFHADINGILWLLTIQAIPSCVNKYLKASTTIKTA